MSTRRAGMRRMHAAALLVLSGAVVAAWAQAPVGGTAASAAARTPTGASAAGAGASAVGVVAEPAAPPAPWQVSGDAALGMRVAQQGAGGAPACASCHGAHGEGLASAGYPRLAGQSASYLVRQLEAYASGARQNPVMAPIAKALDDAQRRAVAVHYAALDPGASATAAAGGAASGAAAGRVAASATSGGAKTNARARQLASQGDNTLRVQACANCHGAGGVGQAPAGPYLAGQVAGYLEAALAEWKSGARKTDPSGQMPVIAQRLGDADVRALAAYYASLPPPPASTRDVAAAWQPSAAGTVVSGPRTAGAAPQGVGSEQGAVTSGGHQGPGGAGAATGAGAQGNRSGGTPPSR